MLPSHASPSFSVPEALERKKEEVLRRANKKHFESSAGKAEGARALRKLPSFLPIVLEKREKSYIIFSYYFVKDSPEILSERSRKMALTEYEKFWDELSKMEEVDYDDERINRLLRFKAIQGYLPGVRTILDVGAATDAFSVPLARMGFDVVHLDLSDEMIKAAKAKAADLTNIRFIQQDAACLDMFEDNAFDLVLCFDGAISFSGRKADKVISEICRVGKKVMLSVSSKSCMTATWLNYSLTKLNRIHPSVMDMMKTGYFCKDNYDDAGELTSIAELKAYDTDELRDVLNKHGMNVLECRSIGSLTHLYLLHLYRQNTADRVSEKINAVSTDKEFLEICDYYDKYVMPNGMGSFRRAGILAAAEKAQKN